MITWNLLSPSSSIFSPGVFAVLVLCASAYLGLNKKRLQVPLPPGPPKKVPFVGSFLHLPKHRPWETYKQWGKEYGLDILHVRGAGASEYIPAGTYNQWFTAISIKYLPVFIRPKFPIADIMGFGYLFAGMVYGKAWQVHRKLFQKHFHPSKPGIHRSLALKSTCERLLPQLLESPNLWEEICRHTIGTYILTITYGIKTKPKNDSFITLSHKAVQFGNEAFLSPVSFLLYLVPVLKLLPEWCLGPGFKQHMEKARELLHKYKNALVDEGMAEPSFTSMCLEKLHESGEGSEWEREEIKDTAAMFITGGMDTTLAGICQFILAMLLYPDKQAKAHEELDRVIGKDKQLPEYEGVPHVNDREDVYNGYYIPKDSIIIPNVWGMLHDEREYPDPESFIPERFLDSQGKGPNLEIRDPPSVHFGFGRRACPGAHISQSTLFILASHILTIYTIKPVVDENGAIKEPSLDWPDLAACPPLPFECQFIPRSESACQLVRAHSLQQV